MVTISGGSGSEITINTSNSNGTISNLANQFVDTLMALDSQDQSLLVVNDTANAPSNPDNKTLVAAVTTEGVYTLNPSYQYVVIGQASPGGALNGPVVLNANGTSANFVNIMASDSDGVTYNAGNESGSFTNVEGSSTFNGAGKSGNWQVSMVGDQSSVHLGSGNNSVITFGSQDTIDGGLGGYQTVTLAGGSASVTLGSSSVVNDISSNNTIVVGAESTVIGGQNDTITIQDGTTNSFIGGINDTVKATNGDLRVVHGTGNNISVDNSLMFLNGSGVSSLSAGDATIFGAQDLDTKFSVTNSGLFVGSQGNETLDGSGSSLGLHVFANTVAGGNSTLVATGGSGNDTLVAGTGSDTFTGGAGNNLFGFIKGTSAGTTVITDFGQSAGNKIGLYNFGLDQQSIQTVLQQAVFDGSNTTLQVASDTIVLEGVSVDQLSAAKFEISNS